MKTVVATVKPSRAATASRKGDLGIALFDAGGEKLAGVGHAIREAARARLPAPPSIRAWDFLTFALAVFATDRFLVRRNAADGWTREIGLQVDLVDPAPWHPLNENIAGMLRFLTGDIWSVEFRDGGMRPPNWHPKLTDRDCVCLFSGGLDSFIGAADITRTGRRPLLVSQASIKEASTQQYLAGRLGLDQNRFAANVLERYAPPYEPSSRSRSILFLGYGIAAASTLPQSKNTIEVYLPENGLISLNPPFQWRRLGSLSTRTTHPHFINQLQRLLNNLDLRVQLINPYRWKTKGEMLANCKSDVVRKFAHASYSCGKGKRLNQHCGRCVPCIIRRAAFVKAKIPDKTGYHVDDLSSEAHNDDVFAARITVAQLASRK